MLLVSKTDNAMFDVMTCLLMMSLDVRVMPPAEYIR